MIVRSWGQWVVWPTIVAMLLNAAVTVNVCLCESCPLKNDTANDCATNKDSFVQIVAGGKHTCCCDKPNNESPHGQSTENEPPEKKSTDKKCGCGSSPFSCLCHDVQEENALEPVIVSLIKKSEIALPWDIVSLGNVSVLQAVTVIHDRQILFPSHVPRHVLLCVFLN